MSLNHKSKKIIFNQNRRSSYSVTVLNWCNRMRIAEFLMIQMKSMLAAHTQFIGSMNIFLMQTNLPGEDKTYLEQKSQMQRFSFSLIDLLWVIITMFYA